jgi:hypothetical protein
VGSVNAFIDGTHAFVTWPEGVGDLNLLVDLPIGVVLTTASASMIPAATPEPWPNKAFS